ncbi:hypothetical protein [uncultured Lactobacillus sp.]|uniref:hypothetical protein n=1 Tax=uncultured Lactobacillus sp. TaxID=153152 RepID=UPI00262BAB6E|nr:hypothetical protein [uncultured Lactobacillus sp.]
MRIRSYNLGPVISTNTESNPTNSTNANVEEATVTVKNIYGVNVYDNQGKRLKRISKLVQSLL